MQVTRPEPLLRCEALSVGHAGRAILPPIDLDIGAEQFWVVVGRNGAGKTTWFRTLLGLHPALGGRVTWPSGPAPLAYVPQRHGFDPLFPLRVRDVVAMGRDRAWSFIRPQLGEPPQVMEALEAVEATALADRTFRSLSEGQKGRVLLARMVASHARIALLDEPTAAMDAIAERDALDLLERLRERFGLTVLVVTHDLRSVRDHATHALLIDPQGVEAGDFDAIVDVFRQRHGSGEVTFG